MSLSNHYIAVDIGASSGRLMLAEISGGKITLEEVHRFKNGFRKVDGHDRWNIDLLIGEICHGLAKVRKMGIEKVTLGIDTWAVDYVLVGSDGRKLCDPVAYRDGRTKDAVEELTTKIPKREVYKKTGIQFQNFNTLYQLYREDRELLKKTGMIMMIPDYIGYVLTGNAVTEVTNASTTQMMNLRHGLFDEGLLHEAGVMAEMFPPLVEAGTELGMIREDLRLEYGLPETMVVTVATHDTASAVAGPGEATAIGNIIVSMISEGDLKNISEGRQLIEDSFELKEYVPSPGKYSGIMEKYQKVTGGK